MGHVYCITANTVNHVKIGYWTGSILGLRSRYITYYGNEVYIFYVKSHDAHKLEQKCHQYFSKYNISNELFDKEYLDEYMAYLEYNMDNCDGKNCICNNSNYKESPNDINRRFNEHIIAYAKVGIHGIRLAQFEYIDPLYASKAETRLLRDMKLLGLMLPHTTYKELIIRNKKDLKEIKSSFKDMSELYSGRCAELKGNLNELEQKNESLTNELQILRESKQELLDSKDKLIARLEKCLSVYEK